MSSVTFGGLDTARRQVLNCWHRYLYKPYYLSSPSRLLHRLTGNLASSATRLPWQLPIMFQPGSIIGTQLARTGVHDLVLSEGLFRITEPRDICVDVGANIGYTTGLLAFRSGPGGRVVCFEPAPDVYALLISNVASWHGKSIATIDARQAAVSSEEREVTLATPAANAGDSGGRTLEHPGETIESFQVRSATLDGSGLDRIDVLKIDVEGHEHAVLEGCRQLLRRRAIRDIVFEEHDPPPTLVTTQLTAAGYTVFRIAHGLRGPRLEANIAREFDIYWDAPNYLATIEPARAIELFQSRGWRCLQPPRAD